MLVQAVAQTAHLCTCTCARRHLDLSDAHFGESAQDFETLDPLVAYPNRLETLDKDTQQFVLHLRLLTGWGPRVWRISSLPLQGEKSWGECMRGNQM